MGQSGVEVADKRHDDALARVRKLTVLGIEAELDFLGAGESAERKAQRRETLFDFELESTMRVAESLDSETLEYIAMQVSTFDHKHGWIHRFLGQVSKWKNTAGNQTATAVRDFVFFRDRDLRANSVHVFVEMYEYLRIKDEGIHLLTGSALQNACAILDVSIHSREVDAFIREGKIELEPWAEIYEVKNLALQASNEAWAADHMTHEMVRYLHENPDHVERIKRYMDETRSPLHAIQMTHFNDYMVTQSSISSGVL
jgi:hypothetical protein